MALLGIFYLGRWPFGMWMEFCFAFSYAGFWVGLVGVFEVFFFGLSTFTNLRDFIAWARASWDSMTYIRER